MSCSIPAAHSSCADVEPARPAGRCRRATRAAAPASAATCVQWPRSGWYCVARLRTLATRTSSNSGGSRRLEVAREEHALAQAGVGDLEALGADRLHRRGDDDRAGEDQPGASRLDPVELRRARRPAATRARSISSSSASRSSSAPCTPIEGLPAACRGRRGEVAHGAADPDHRPAESLAASRRAASSLERVRAQRVALLGAARACSLEEALGHAHGAERPRGAVASSRRSRTRTSCRLPPPRSSTAPSRSVVELTAAR